MSRAFWNDLASAQDQLDADDSESERYSVVESSEVAGSDYTGGSVFNGFQEDLPVDNHDIPMGSTPGAVDETINEADSNAVEEAAAAAEDALVAAEADFVLPSIEDEIEDSAPADSTIGPNGHPKSSESAIPANPVDNLPLSDNGSGSLKTDVIDSEALRLQDEKARKAEDKAKAKLRKQQQEEAEALKAKQMSDEGAKNEEAAVPSNTSVEVQGVEERATVDAQEVLGEGTHLVSLSRSKPVGLTYKPGLLEVQSVTPGEQASLAGVVPGAVVVAVNGRPVATMADLMYHRASDRLAMQLTLRVSPPNNALAVDTPSEAADSVTNESAPLHQGKIRGSTVDSGDMGTSDLNEYVAPPASDILKLENARPLSSTNSGAAATDHEATAAGDIPIATAVEEDDDDDRDLRSSFFKPTLAVPARGVSVTAADRASRWTQHSIASVGSEFQSADEGEGSGDDSEGHDLLGRSQFGLSRDRATLHSFSSSHEHEGLPPDAVRFMANRNASNNAAASNRIGNRLPIRSEGIGVGAAPSEMAPPRRRIVSIDSGDDNDEEESENSDRSPKSGAGRRSKKNLDAAGAAVKGAFQGIGQRARATSARVRERLGSAEKVRTPVGHDSNHDDDGTSVSAAAAGAQQNDPLTPRRRRVMSVDEPEGEGGDDCLTPGNEQSRSGQGLSSASRSGGRGASTGRRQSLLLGGGFLRRGGGLALLTRGDRVIRYRAAFHDHDYGGTGSLGLLVVEEAVRSFGFETTDPTVRRIIGKHFEAVAETLGVSADALGAYFDACAAAAAGPGYGKEHLHAPVSAPSPPPGFSFTSSHFIALLEELKDAPLNDTTHTNASSSSGGGARARRGSVFGGSPRSGSRKTGGGGDGPSSSSSGRRGGIRGGASITAGTLAGLVGEELFEEETPLGRLSVRLVRVRGIAAAQQRHRRSWSRSGAGFFGRWLSKRPRPLKKAPTVDQEERARSGLGYFRLNDRDNDDDGDNETLEDLDQFEVGVSVSGLSTVPADSSAPSPVLTIQSPPFDQEAPSEVMFARHVEFNNVRALPNASLSAVASAASVLLEFRLRQSKKSQMAESAAKAAVSTATNSNASGNPSTTSSGSTSWGGLDPSQVVVAENTAYHPPVAREQAFFGWCDVSLLDPLRRVAHRREAAATRKARKQGAKQARLEAKQLAKEAKARSKAKRKAAEAARRSLAFDDEDQGEEGDEFLKETSSSPPLQPSQHWWRRSLGLGPSHDEMAARGTGGGSGDEDSTSDDSEGASSSKQKKRGRKDTSSKKGLKSSAAAQSREDDSEDSDDSDQEGGLRSGKSKASPWDALKWYPILDPSGRQVGEAYVGVRFDLSAVNNNTTTNNGPGGGRDGGLQSLTAVEQLLFAMYDVDEDGLLSPQEFTTLVHDLRQVHGDIDALAGRRSNPGCLGRVIGLPDTDLMTYVKSNHTLSPLVLGHVAADHWSVGVGGVEITRLGHLLVLALTLVYSFTVNALVEVAFWHIESEAFHDSGIEPTVVVFVKTLVDVVGSSFLKEMLFFSNLHHLHPALRVALNLVLILLVFATSLYLLFATQITDEQLQGVWDSFVAVWFLARITEIFHLGTLWAIKVSYGSSVGCSLL